MITATCKNATCSESGTNYLVLGQHDRVECGLCGKNTELTNPQPDPEWVGDPYGVNIQ